MPDVIEPKEKLAATIPSYYKQKFLSPTPGRIYPYEVYREYLPEAPDPTPVREPYSVLDDSGNPRYVNRVLVSTPTTGRVWMQWVQARHSAVIPTNWSQVQMIEYLPSFNPMRYELADAQNLIVKQVITGDFEWLLLIEQDNLVPIDIFLRLNYYMREGRVPIVSGLYYTKNVPTEPLIYRGRGTGAYTDWEVGDLVWCDGVPTGCLLIHRSILQVMWDEAETYEIARGNGHLSTNRVFVSPRDAWFDPESHQFNTRVGTTDLEWCSNLKAQNVFEKAGWHYLAEQEYPLLVDTNLFVRHIDDQGRIYPEFAVQEMMRQREMYEKQQKEKADE